ncbi:hypothetical protein [Arachidicoccus soli]|uniref:Lipoprotein n=1 Tax=Arachidicoccus soli TaxID=2341117 RepID=A0A386HNZ8_9BACT|nr:hypothetical protein [Arachidicoccus soli]AYD47220.1 hypothetical protein D6B99_06090 [Arachidicoccus soli]
MRKLFFFAIMLITFASCQTDVSEVSLSLKKEVKTGILHSLFSNSSKNSSDSSASQPSINHFNFFLKDGFARKFGL